MLGHTYRYQVFDNAGVNVTAVVKERPFKFASGAKVDGDEIAHSINGGFAFATATYAQGPTTDNSTTKWLGADLTWTATPSATSTGTVALYLQRSPDGGTTWPAAGKGEWLSTITFAGTAAVTQNAKVR